MSDEMALAQVNAFLAVTDLVMDVAVSPANKFKQMEMLVLSAARQQILSETNDDSPWHITEAEQASMDRRTIEKVIQKEGMLSYQIATRALAIISNWQDTLEIAWTDVAMEMRKRQIASYPPDGEWKPLEKILWELAPGSRKGSAGQVIQFLEKTAPAFEVLDVPPEEVAKAVANRGVYTLGRIAGATTKIIRDPDLLPEQKREKILDILADAQAMSLHDFDERYKSRRVPLLPYAVQHQDDGSSLHLFLARTERQADLLRNRMKDQTEQSEVLFRPVTAAQIIEARDTGEWGELLKSAVLADPAARAIYRMMEASGQQCDQDYFLQYSSLSPQRVTQALDELERYSLIESARYGNIKTWIVKNL